MGIIIILIIIIFNSLNLTFEVNGSHGDGASLRGGGVVVASSGDGIDGAVVVKQKVELLLEHIFI